MTDNPNIYDFPGSRGGGGSSGSGGVTWKDYVDAQDNMTRAQNDARFSEVVSGLDKIGNLLSAQGSVVASRFDGLDAELDTVKTAAARAETAASTVKWNILATAIAVIGVLIAFWAMWAQGIEMMTGLIDSQAISADAESGSVNKQ